MPRPSDPPFDPAHTYVSAARSARERLHRLLHWLSRRDVPGWLLPLRGSLLTNPKSPGEIIQTAYLQWANAMIAAGVVMSVLLLIGWALRGFG